jgi:hypothetical protein
MGQSEDSRWELDPAYVAARRVLLDALTALADHAPALVVAGAQAVYLRTDGGDVSVAVAPYTTDGDLALDPTRLHDDPQLEEVMERAGFHLQIQDGGHVEPGIWVAEARVDGKTFVVPVDIIVPEGVAPPGGSRGARLGPHGRRAARRAVGLEAALIDNDEMVIEAFEREDDRAFRVRVAGVAALIVAKVHKLHDRLERGGTRLDDKDAGDVVRMMQTSDPRAVGATWGLLLGDDIAGEVSGEAVAYFDEMFGRRGGAGIEMAARAFRLGLPPERVEALCLAYVGGVSEARR